MLLEFRFQNLRSFREEAVLSLEKSAKKAKYAWLDEKNVHQKEHTEALKVKVLYGANGSGKSNVRKALEAFCKVVRWSFSSSRALSDYLEPFLLDVSGSEQPTFFELSFLLEGVQYRYGFEADRERVHSEWLFAKASSREKKIFTREGDELSAPALPKTVLSLVSSKSSVLSSSALLLSLLGRIAEEQFSPILNYIQSIETVGSLLERDEKRKLREELNDPEVLAWSNGFLSGVDPTLQRIELVDEDADMFDGFMIAEPIAPYGKQRKARKAISIREVFDAEGKSKGTLPFDLEKHESDGTVKLLDLCPAIFKSLSQGSALFIDEIDARIHPNLVERVVQLFQEKSSNPLGAQLICTTHLSNLLDNTLLRRDQIAFVEKDQYGGSHLYGLDDLKGVRSDASYEKEYLTGAYGAIPNLNAL